MKHRCRPGLCITADYESSALPDRRELGKDHGNSWNLLS